MARFIESMQTKGLTTTLSERDAPFGDYRTSHGHDDAAATAADA
jgi:hypothetical protein